MVTFRGRERHQLGGVHLEWTGWPWAVEITTGPWKGSPAPQRDPLALLPALFSISVPGCTMGRARPVSGYVQVKGFSWGRTDPVPGSG